jgi:hypothetical protein
VTETDAFSQQVYAAFRFGPYDHGAQVAAPMSDGSIRPNALPNRIVWIAFLLFFIVGLIVVAVMS